MQQGTAFPHRAGTGLVRPRAGVRTNASLVGLIGVPVDETVVVVGNEHLPLALRQSAAAGAQHPVLVDVTFEAGLAVDVRAGVDGMGEHLVHRGVGRLHPDDVRVGVVDVALQRHLQTLLLQPQPHSTGGATKRELFEDCRQDATDGLVRVQQDLPAGFAPHQPDRQTAAQLPAGGLVADSAVKPGAQDVKLGLGHGALHSQQEPVVEHGRVVDAVGVGDERVGDSGQVEQPVPVSVVAGQPGDLQRHDDTEIGRASCRERVSECV